jgi:hypothetical protein
MLRHALKSLETFEKGAHAGMDAIEADHGPQEPKVVRQTAC